MRRSTTKNNRVRYGGEHYYAVFGITLILAISLISGIFYWLYTTSRQNLVNTWKVNAVHMARDVEYYLTRPMDAVVFASRHVEEMMEDGASNDQIKAYLVDETSVYSSMVDSDNTGVYGYCNKEYLDGSGWEPEADYVATERPWC